GLSRYTKEVVAQAELQLQVPSGGDAVLNEGAERLGEEVVGSIAERNVERIAQPGLKCGNARIGKGASIQVEAGMLAPPNLPTELDDVIPAQVRRRVSPGNRRDRAAVWKPGRSAEVQVEALDRDLRQRDREVDTDADAEIRRVDHSVGIEGDVQPVEAQPRLVHERLAEDV